MSKAPFPFEERPLNCPDPFWRYSQNPIIPRNPVEGLARVFNSSLIPVEDGYIGVFRGEDRDNVPHIFLGHSKDGIHIELNPTPITFVYEDGGEDDSQYQYDPRLIEVEGLYYIIYCDDFHDLPSISIAYTEDFKTFKKLRHPFPPDSRNGVLFPQKINGEYWMLYRPSAGGSAHSDIYLAKSKDLRHWGEYSRFMAHTKFGWGKYKIGGGCNPILTKNDGWLLIYHGVIDTCDGLIYSIGGALLDKDDPSKVTYRCRNYLLTPETPYELNGFTNTTIFPCSALVDEETGRLALYYGAADAVVGLAFSTVDTLVDYIKKYSD